MGTTLLPGAGKYYASIQRQQEASRVTTRVQRLIDRANAVSIFDVLRDFFSLDVPADGSMKMRCPFADEHSDGGLERSWRAYPGTNSSFCFSDHGLLTPVRLIQMKNGWHAPRSAELVLSAYGLLAPRNYRDRYNQLLVEAEQREQTRQVNPQYIVQALHTALSGLPSYRLRQFDTDVMAAMERALSGLDLVIAHHPDRIEEWFDRAKTALLRTVEEGTP